MYIIPGDGSRPRVAIAHPRLVTLHGLLILQREQVCFMTCPEVRDAAHALQRINHLRPENANTGMSFLSTDDNHTIYAE